MSEKVERKGNLKWSSIIASILVSLFLFVLIFINPYGSKIVMEGEPEEFESTGFSGDIYINSGYVEVVGGEIYSEDDINIYDNFKGKVFERSVSRGGLIERLEEGESIYFVADDVGHVSFASDSSKPYMGNIALTSQTYSVPGMGSIERDFTIEFSNYSKDMQLLLQADVCMQKKVFTTCLLVGGRMVFLGPMARVYYVLKSRLSLLILRGWIGYFQPVFILKMQ